jgi:DNA replication ATP-dependent helicase Dna2
VAEGDFSQNSLRVHAAEAIREFNIPLYAAKQTDESVSKAVESQLPIVEKWAKSYLHKAPRPDSTPIELHSETFRISISKALEIEEHIWSLMYGLKGSIDVSVEAVVEADKQRRNLELPLELKSGRRSVSHAAQVIIYSLLMADRYGSFIAFVCLSILFLRMFNVIV